jgi:hypothetical protein
MLPDALAEPLLAKVVACLRLACGYAGHVLGLTRE